MGHRPSSWQLIYVHTVLARYHEDHQPRYEGFTVERREEEKEAEEPQQQQQQQMMMITWSLWASTIVLHHLQGDAIINSSSFLLSPTQALLRIISSGYVHPTWAVHWLTHASSSFTGCLTRCVKGIGDGGAILDYHHIPTYMIHHDNNSQGKDQALSSCLALAATSVSEVGRGGFVPLRSHSHVFPFFTYVLYRRLRHKKDLVFQYQSLDKSISRLIIVVILSSSCSRSRMMTI